MSPRQALADAYRALAGAGLIGGSSGNISVRDGAGMLISPTGATAGRIDADAFVACGLDRAAPGASSEWALHGALYAARPELCAIVHTHSDACTALACLGQDLPAFHYGVLAFGGAQVRCAPYTTFGTPDLARLALAAMEQRTACLLANHGMIVAGATLAAAVDGASMLERLARQYLLALSAGTPRLLSAVEIGAAQERWRSYQRARPDVDPAAPDPARGSRPAR